MFYLEVVFIKFIKEADHVIPVVSRGGIFREGSRGVRVSNRGSWEIKR